MRVLPKLLDAFTAARLEARERGLREISGGGVDTVPTGIIAGTAGSLMSAPIIIAVPGNSSVVLGQALSTPAVPSGPGVYCITAMGANVRFEVFDGAVWQIVVAVGGISPFIYSDGVSFRFTNVGGASQNAVIQKIG